MFLGIDSHGNQLRVDAVDLTTHGVILGRTGSGKTGLTVALLEEIAESGASAIVFDPKGDLTNIALSLASKADFANWAESGVDVNDTFASHVNGLSKYGMSAESIMNWRHKVDVTIYAPGKTYGGGKSINVFPTFEVPSGDMVPPRERASREVGAVMQAIGNSGDPYAPAQVFLTEAVTHAWSTRQALPVNQWPGVLSDPPQKLQSFGGMSVDEFFPKRNRTKLARKLIGFCHQADRWLSGEQLDLHKFAEGRSNIAVFTMRHLDEEERQFFTSLMMNKLVDFMFEAGASQKLKLVIAMDEARGYLPPYPNNPPTKGPICTILAQGRAQGIGMLIGTQNPMDLDYKALSNVGTWFVGRLRERDCNRDLTGELRNRNVEISEVENLPQRKFLLLDKRGGHSLLTVRHTMNYLRGPLSAQDLLRLDKKSAPSRFHVRVKPRTSGNDNPATRPARRKFWGQVFGLDK